MRVNFLRNGTIPVTVCNHRLGAIATISQETDTLASPSRYGAEVLAFKHNIGITANINPYDSSYDTVLDMAATGRWSFGLYFPTDRMYLNGSVQYIPDYAATTWTSAGAAVFANAVVGATKATKYPNHGQEFYDISNGLYGYDFPNTKGSNNLQEVFGLTAYLQKWYYNQLFRYPSSFSYRNGKLGIAPFLVTTLLAGKNSDYSISGSGRTTYGYNLGTPAGTALSRLDRISQANSCRWKDSFTNYGLTLTQANAYAVQQLTDIMSNGGWRNDFNHFHEVWSSSLQSSFNDYFALINSTIGSNFVSRSGYGEAMEYMFMRDMIDQISAYESGGKIKIIVSLKDIFKGNQTTPSVLDNIPFSCFGSNISLSLSLTGTTLAGLEVKSSKGKILKNGDNIIVDFHLNFRDGLSTVEISQASVSDYINLSIPTGTATKLGSTITATSSIPTKAVLFNVASGGNDYDSTIVARDNELSTSHVFSSALTGDFRVGLISEYNQSALISVSNNQ